MGGVGSLHTKPEMVQNSGLRSDLVDIPARRISLLLMEDDQLTCKSIGKIISLKFPDIAIYKAFSGKEGIELFKKHVFDIVVTDISLPDIDGMQAAVEIKSIKADTKFIVLTGHNGQKYLDKFREIGFSDYIVKPIEFAKLFAAIDKCCSDIMLPRK